MWHIRLWLAHALVVYAMCDALHDFGPIARSHCDFRRISGHGLSVGEFASTIFDHDAVMIYDAFKVSEKLIEDDLFLRLYGDRYVQANNGFFDNRRLDKGMMLATYISNDQGSWHIFEADSDAGHNALVRDVQHHFLPSLPTFLREFDERRILTVGKYATSIRAHRHKENWLALLAGAKAWCTPKLRQKGDASEQTSHAHDPCSVFKKWISGDQTDFLCCVQFPGDITYLGDRVEHATCNLENFTLGVGAQGHTSHWPPIVRAAHHADLGQLQRSVAHRTLRSVEWSETLHEAVKSGNASVVSYLLKQRAQIPEKFISGIPPIHVSVAHGHSHLVELMLSYGSDAAAPGDAGVLPIHIAALKGHTSVVSLLLESSANLKAIDAAGNQALHHAMSRGHIAMVKLLTTRRASVQDVDAQGRQGIHHAARFGHSLMLNYLLSQRIHVATASRSGEHALHFALNEGHDAVVELLLQKRATYDTSEEFVRLSMHKAARTGHIAVVRLLLDRRSDLTVMEDGNQPIHAASSAGHALMVDFLLRHRVSAQAIGAQGVRPLHYAALNGHTDVVGVLLAHGGDALATDDLGLQPIDFAAHRSHRGVMNVLLNHGGSITSAQYLTWFSNQHAMTLTVYGLIAASLWRLLVKNFWHMALPVDQELTTKKQ